jgi:hypothetical protein
MEMRLAGYTPYPTTLAVGSSALSIRLAAFGTITHETSSSNTDENDSGFVLVAD